MMTEKQIDLMRSTNEANEAAARAAVLAVDPTAELSFHYMGAAEWYEVRSGAGKVLGEADASTVFTGAETAWKNALKKLSKSRPK